MLYVIFRIAFAVLLAVFLSKIIFRFFKLEGFDDSETKSSKKTNDDVIDICPECGRVRKEDHRCP